MNAAFSDIGTNQRRQSADLNRRLSEIKTKHDRLLDAYLAGTVDEQVYQTKTAQLKSDEAAVRESIEALREVDESRGETAIAVFDWSRKTTLF